MRPRTKGALLLLLAFLLGVVSGAMGFAVYRARWGWREVHENPARLQQVVLSRLTRELRLRPDQQQQVEAILRDAGQQFAKLREEIRPRFREIRLQTQARIQAVLDAEQAKEFAALLTRWRQREQEHR
jgi:hypothetical protein